MYIGYTYGNSRNKTKYWVLRKSIRIGDKVIAQNIKYLGKERITLIKDQMNLVEGRAREIKPVINQIEKIRQSEKLSPKVKLERELEIRRKVNSDSLPEFPEIEISESKYKEHGEKWLNGLKQRYSFIGENRVELKKIEDRQKQMLEKEEKMKQLRSELSPISHIKFVDLLQKPVQKGGYPMPKQHLNKVRKMTIIYDRINQRKYQIDGRTAFMYADLDLEKSEIYIPALPKDCSAERRKAFYRWQLRKAIPTVISRRIYKLYINEENKRLYNELFGDRKRFTKDYLGFLQGKFRKNKQDPKIVTKQKYFESLESINLDPKNTIAISILKKYKDYLSKKLPKEAIIIKKRDTKKLEKERQERIKKYHEENKKFRLEHEYIGENPLGGKDDH